MTKRLKRAVAKAQPPRVKRRLLLVDDQEELRITAKWFLNLFGYAVDLAHNAEEALVLFDYQRHDLVITDNSMPGMTGAEMAHIVKLRSPKTPVVMYTDQPPSEHSCLDAVLQRPTHLMALKDLVESLLGQRPGRETAASAGGAPHL